MSNIVNAVNSLIDEAEASYRIPRRYLVILIISPMVLDLIALVLLRLNATSEFSKWMLAENHPVEMLTFAFLMIAGIMGMVLARNCIRCHEPVWVSGFYILFSACLLLVGLEEVSWGQQIFKFETFDAFKEINRQHETNLHNIGALQGNSAYFRFVFGFGGLIGVLMSLRNIWSKITPSELLVTWFLVIAFFGALGIYKNISGDTRLYYALSLRSLSELNEMLIGLSSLFFIWLNMRRFELTRSVKIANRLMPQG